jgi:hypothetical protein
MAKKNTDSLSSFDFLDDIDKEFASTVSPEIVEKIEKESGVVAKEPQQPAQHIKEVPPPTTMTKQGRPSGYFVQQFPEELRQSGVKNITIYEKVHEQLHDLVYHISKAHTKEGKDRVTMLGVSVKALLIGIEELKKTYKID